MIGGPPLVEKLVCWQGVDFLKSYAFFTAIDDLTDVQNYTPMDFTGAAARMNIRLAADPASTSVLTLSGTAGGSSSGLIFIKDTFTPGPALPTVYNGIEISITKAQALSMNGGAPFTGGYYDILVDNSDGTTSLLICGEFQLLPTVTR